MGMQKELLKLKFHQQSLFLFQLHLAPQPKSTGLAGRTVPVLEAQASHRCQAGTTPLHTQNAQSSSSRQNPIVLA